MTETTTKTRRRAQRRTLALASLAGVVSAGSLLAVSELFTLILGRAASPLIAVGQFVIDIVPKWAKDLVIALFGTNDKIVLLLSLGLAVFIAACVGGVLQYVRPPLGIVVVVIAGGLATAAVVTRAGAGPVDAIPTIVGAIAAAVVMQRAVARLRGGRASEQSSAEESGLDRRGFLRFTLVTAAAAAVVGVGSRVAGATLRSITAAREAISLPAPASRVPIPDGADLGIDGVSPLFVPNADFYRIDTALDVPQIDPSTWSLTVTGMVDREVTLSYQDLLDMGLDEYVVTLTCVSNEVGGPLLGNAKWLGVPIRDVLALASPSGDSDMVLSRSVDGFTAGTPLEVLQDPMRDAILAVAMNGEPLPLEHGFPVRMVVPGLYGYVSATKWLSELKLTRFDLDEGYWTPRGWDARGPIKISSRLDTPKVSTAVPAGPTKIAGVAWAQPVGIAAVDITIDDSDWMPATLAKSINDDSWVQWYVDWQATSGTHTITVRATDKDGNVQVEERARPAPNGSTGLQRSLVRVA
jgi:DMSO/TMAO reductase YedYZ molybdopterin-dependent catalytic subunit